MPNSNRNSINPDVVVIGAGPAGAAAAAYLNSRGHKVLVLEKERFPRFVIGESLLPNCMNFLEEAGLLPAIGKNDFQVKSGATFFKGEQRCDFYFSEQYTKGWSWTWQVQRDRFDHLLIQEAERQGVTVKFETEVTKVVTAPDAQTLWYKNAGGVTEQVTCKFIVDASGFGRVLPRLFNLNEASALEGRGSIFTHVEDINCDDTANNNIFVHTFNNNQSWVWAIPFSNRTASIGIVSGNDHIINLAKDNSRRFVEFIHEFPGLKARFANSKLLFEPKNILGYSIGVKKMYGEGFVLCGNSTEFLDPIFSSGVMLALASAVSAAKLTDKHLSGENVDWHGEYEQVMKKGIDIFRSFVTAWYDGSIETIIFAKEVDEMRKNQICSVLAGYVWDETNPFVKKHKTLLSTLAKIVAMQNPQPYQD